MIRKAILLAAVALFLVGCETGQKITVARIDTAELLQADPEYQGMATDYLKAQTDVKREFIEGLQKAKSAAQKDVARESYRESQQNLDKQWSEKTRDFLETRHSAIKDSVAEICEAKTIDLVLIDSKYYPTVEWGAVDITQDVQLKLAQ